MRIAVVSAQVFPCPPPGYSGLEHIAWLTARGLAQRDHQVTLIAPEGSHCEGATVFSTGAPGQWDEEAPFAGFKFKVQGKNEKGEMVEEERSHPPYWPLLLQQDVVIDHSWHKWAYTLKMEGTLKAPVLGVMHAPINTMYGSLPPVDKPCMVCISQDQANHFEGVFSRPARVCHNGVDRAFYQSIQIPRTERFLFLGRFSTIKGPDLAIEACRKAGVGLDLVGDVSITNEPAFLDHCRRLADGDQIRIIGPANRGECVHWLSQARALLHPNQRFREPFGLAPVEAMLCGCPVIGWCYGALKETIQHGRTGLLVDSFEALVEAIHYVCAAADVVETMRAQGRDWAARFSVEHMVARYEELCHEALAGGW